MFIDWRCMQAFSGPCQIRPHQLQCAFDVLMVAGATLSAFARSLKVPYLNNLAHLLIALLLIDPLRRQQVNRRHLSFLPAERFFASVSCPLSENHSI